MARQLVDNSTLDRWRGLSAAQVLVHLADHAKQDSSFSPTTAVHTARWHARFGDREFELLCTGPKFFDTRANKGGGGAVDLVAHCLGLDFKATVRLLQDRGV
jgi:hypothetical protein